MLPQTRWSIRTKTQACPLTFAYGHMHVHTTALTAMTNETCTHACTHMHTSTHTQEYMHAYTCTHTCMHSVSMICIKNRNSVDFQRSLHLGKNAMALGNSLAFEWTVSSPKSGVAELTLHPDQSTHVTAGYCFGAGLVSCALELYLNYISYMVTRAC